ncbi:hypothetical protein B0T16DRAFT_35940 [Cercophora newfieldiana]|uniref:Uncharacterized protein n=1 Tax=Cercophora newfieldiana TaxID=92897 RepID=A0AA39YPM6_9PEZI|nr:hypothetical protein B0T16DRAFT_35940 [Cercophora newfieldiana]
MIYRQTLRSQKRGSVHRKVFFVVFLSIGLERLVPNMGQSKQTTLVSKPARPETRCSCTYATYTQMYSFLYTVTIIVSALALQRR